MKRFDATRLRSTATVAALLLGLVMTLAGGSAAAHGGQADGSAQTGPGELADVRAEPHADIAALQQLVGNWRLATEYLVAGERVAGPDGYVEYRLGMNGLAVIKTGYHPSPGGAHPVFSSVTVYTWAPHDEAVVAASNNSLGNRKTLNGRRTDDGFVFTQGGRLFGGRPGHNEIRLILHSADRYEIRQAYCPDGEGSCEESYWAVGTRLPEH